MKVVLEKWVKRRYGDDGLLRKVRSWGERLCFLGRKIGLKDLKEVGLVGEGGEISLGVEEVGCGI